MLVMKIALLTLHIASAAVMFGVPLGVASHLRRALDSREPGVLRAAAADAARRGLLNQVGSVVTLLTGLALIFLVGGFGVVPPTIHAALGLLLLAMGLNAMLFKPAGVKLVAAAAATPPDLDAFGVARKRLAMGSGVLQSIWLIILVLMLKN